MGDPVKMVVVAVAVLAVLAAWWFGRSAARWRLRASASELAMHKAQETLEQHRGPARLGAAVLDLAPSLAKTSAAAAEAAPPAVAPDALQSALSEHQRRVRAYDDAVQYCLQPVELMPGAAKDDLDQLVKLVSDARRRLFAARDALLAHDDVARLAQAAVAPRPAPPAPQPGVAQALAGVVRITRDGGDVASLLPDLLTVAQARCGEGNTPFASQLDSLPAQPAPPWLAPTLLHLIKMTAELAGDSGELAVRAHVRQGDGIDIEALGQRPDVLAPTAITTFDEQVKDVAQRLDERGAALAVVPGDTRSRGFTLHLPGAAPAAAAPAAA